MKKEEIMTPRNNKWDEFCAKLEGKEGCDFKAPKGNEKKVTWKCKGGNNKEKATEILKSMGMNIKESLAYFEGHGGYCDCEILFNVEESAKTIKTKR